MKHASLIGSVCLVLFLGSVVRGQAFLKCFQAEWLQGERTINLLIGESKVSGTFAVASDDHSPDRTYKFTGTRRANTLTVAFADNQLPDVAPSEMKSLVWNLVRVRGRELLRIKFSGKNYETNRYETRFADFAPCAPVYAALVRDAQRVLFDKGADSASVPLQALSDFQDMSEPATFLLDAARGQALEISAEGSSVEVYLPNKTVYHYLEWSGKTETTYVTARIDGMAIKSLPLTGTYLVVLRKPAENMRPSTVTFRITR